MELLKDKVVAPAVFEALRKRKPYKPLEATQLRLDSSTLTTSWSRAPPFGGRDRVVRRLLALWREGLWKRVVVLAMATISAHGTRRPDQA